MRGTFPTGGVGFGLLVMTEPGTGVAETRAVLDLARHIDGRGFDAFFSVDHVHLAGDRYLAEPRDVERPFQLECWTMLAAIAAVTEHLRVGPLVTPLPLRHPAIVAKMAATIDVLSGGRTLLCVGTGWKAIEYETYHLPYEDAFKRRFGQMVEGVEMIQALWTTDAPIDFRGEHYQLDGARFYPKPAQRPRPPVWFGGAGASTLDAIARIGDGWTPAAPHYDAVSPEVYAAGLATIRTRAAAYGRNPDAITPAILVNTAVDVSRAEAIRLAGAHQLRADWASKTVDEQRDSGVLAVGTPDDIVEHLKRYYRAGARFFTVCPVPFRMDDAGRMATLYQEAVIPAFRDWAAREPARALEQEGPAMTFVADWCEAPDFGAMRRARLERVRAEMAIRGLDALLVFRPENTRYVASLRPLWMPTWLFLNAAVITLDGDEPIVWAMSDDYPHRAEVMTFLRRDHVRRFPGAIEGSEDARATLRTLVEGMADLGFHKGRLGVDIIVMNALEQLRELLPDVEVVDGEWCMRGARLVKTPEEVTLMRDGCRAVDAAFEIVYDVVRPGLRETEVLAEAYHELFRLGAEVPQSAGIVASGDHSSPMQRFASDRIMQNGDLAWIDIGGCFNGIFCEATRAIAVGTPSARQVEIHQAAYDVQQDLLGTIRAGVTATELQDVARRHLDPLGLTRYLQTGPLLHGIGVGSAEPPWIPGPGTSFDLTLAAGMTFSAVPTLQVPGVLHGGGVRLEDQFVVTADGIELFTRTRYDERLLA